MGKIKNEAREAGRASRAPGLRPFTVTEILLQVVHDLRGVADDAVAVDQDGHLAGGVEVHEPGLVVLAEGQAHVVLLAAQAFLRDGQTHLPKGTRERARNV